MTENEWRMRATMAAESVYRRFIEEVVEQYVINDRIGGQLGEKTRKKVENETMIDPRLPRLMTISGKGGCASDPEKQEGYDKFFNISLLDHVLSVSRGAIMLAAFDWAAQNPEIKPETLKQRLCMLIVISFCHDIDKDLQLTRNTALESSLVAERMDRYGLHKFMSNTGIHLSPDQLRYLVEKVEATQAHRNPPDELPPREYESLPLYVRLADRLDGAWLSTDPETGGLQGVVKLLSEDQSCLHTQFLKLWKPVHLFDPHHPFLLDELQRWVSLMCLDVSGIAPLVEVHHDGHLFMLIPEERYCDIVMMGVDLLCRNLPFKLKLYVSNRGMPSLYNGKPNHEDLIELIENQFKAKDFADLFKIKSELVDSLEQPLDGLLADIGLAPALPSNPTGALTSLFAQTDSLTPESEEWLYRAAHLVLLLNLKVDAKPKDGVPSPSVREEQLLDLIKEDRPNWITDISDDSSRRIVTALWVTVLGAKDEIVFEKVWNEKDCLLKIWLEGRGHIPGFNQFIQGDGADVVEGVRKRLQQLLAGERVTAKEELAKGRCIFTDEPVAFDRTISQATGLYGVKVSAFSGREGRPELINSERSHTNVGFTSIAEHKMRFQVHECQGGKSSGVPTFVSSPTTSGLFGGLGLTSDRSMGAMSLYDLNRFELKKGRVLKGPEIYQGRYRMARLERLPETLEGQVNFLRMLLNASRRLGRPVHLFRGLPVLRKEYFYFDAMPRVLAELLGGNALMLEQIPESIKQLKMAADLIKTNGLGYEVLMQYAGRKTRFGAICLAWCHLRSFEEKKSELSNRLYAEFLTQMEDRSLMTEQDGALVSLGKAAAGIQQNPGGMASANEELMVFKICLDTANEARRVGQEDADSLIHAIAGELETNLIRKGKAAAKTHREGKALMDACFSVAELFVNNVWLGVLGGKSPTQKSRRILSSIYRMAFLKTHHDRAQENRKNS